MLIDLFWKIRASSGHGGMRSALAIVFIVVIGVSCSGKGLPKYSKLGSLRILGVQANPPEVAAGATASLSMVVSALDRGATQASIGLTYTMETCTDPGVASGAIPSCSHDPFKTSQSGSFSLSFPYFSKQISLPSVSVPSSLLTGVPTPVAFNGISYLVLITINDGSDSVTALKRILVSTRPTKNSNPTLTAILSDGANLGVLPKVTSALTPQIGLGSESYQEMAADGSISTKNEVITVSWFLSEGNIQYTRTDGNSPNQYTPNQVPERPVLLIPIIRDDRGGEGILTSGSGLYVVP